MANPNLLSITTVIGMTTAVGLSTTADVVFVSNADASGKVLKINTISAANIDGTNTADITIRYNLAAAGAGSSVPIANTISIPADSSLVIIGKDNPIYLEEDRSLTAQASAADDIAIVCSYEEIG
jgi:hypothetical protein